MATPSLADSEFVLGPCAECGKDVLTYVDLDEHDAETRHCLHCSAILDDRLRTVTADELEAAGYGLVEARGCGNGGGCSAGGCGVRDRA